MAVDEASVVADEIAAQARSVAPVLWLLGKVQSGKSSIIRALTGSTRAEVGDGFKACTQDSAIFELPAEAPVIRFLDTRGLGEASYDPAEDLEVAAKSSHCAIVVMRAMDTQQQVVMRALSTVRRTRPDWPVIVVQTCLHEGYDAGMGHLDPYPFGTDGYPLPQFRNSVPLRLVRSLTFQQMMFHDLPGDGPIAFVPVDFTLPEDGLTPRDYGLEMLQEQIVRVAPHAVSTALRAAGKGGTGEAGRTNRLLLGYAMAAAGADLIPLAAVAAVPAVQARLLQVLSDRYGVKWSRRFAMEFAGVLGAGFLARYAAGFGIRQLTKLIPAYGQTAGAAAAAVTSFATTYALGRAAEVYLMQRYGKASRDDQAVRDAWARGLAEAFLLARESGLGLGGGQGGSASKAPSSDAKPDATDAPKAEARVTKAATTKDEV